MNQTLDGEIHHFFFLKDQYNTILLHTFPINQKRAELKNNSKIPLKVTESQFPVVWKIIIKKTRQRFLFFNQKRNISYDIPRIHDFSLIF